MALASQTQGEFGGGIYRGRRAPSNAVYDAVNALIDNEGQMFRRGGSEYKTTSDAPSTLLGLASVQFPVFGPALLAWNATRAFVYDTGAMSAISATNDDTPRAFARGVGVTDKWFVPPANPGASAAWIQVDDGSTPAAAAVSSAIVGDAEYVAAVGSPARLVLTNANKAYFSERGDPSSSGFTAGNYHELPLNARIIGADSVSDTAILFTTAGVWAISNMAFDPVDAYGNIQHTVSQANKDLILWGDPGIAGWRGIFIVPAIDDVYLWGLEAAPQTITGGRTGSYDGGIRDLYRSYVKAGYQPGLAAVHRGHYWLPILNGSTLVDVLVCRLDSGFPWTRWAGHAASTAYVQDIAAVEREPALYSTGGLRVLDLTGTLDPSAANAVEADGTTSDCVITTRDYPLGAQQPGFAKNARLRYELTDDGSGGTAAPTVAVAFSSDQDAGVFTTLTDKGLQGGGTGGAVSDGSKYSWWLVAKRRERLRLRITVAGACASFVLRSIEVLLRPSGKQ